MSIKLMSTVWDMHGLPAHLKLVLLRLADHANEEGYCRPGEDLIALKVGQASRTVRHNLDVLERMGIVERLGRRSHPTRAGRTMQYQLHIPVSAPEAVDWETVAARAAQAVKDPADMWARSPGWYMPDTTRQPVAGQNPDEGGPALTPIESPDSPSDGHSERQSAAGLDSHPNRQPSAPKPATQRTQTGNRLPDPIRKNHHEPSGTTTPREPPPDGQTLEPVTVVLARRWADLKGIPFEGARRSLVPAVAAAVGALRRDGVDVDDRLLVRADRQGIRHPQGWWMAVIRGDTRPACDRCGGRQQLAVLLDGRTVPFTDEDLVHDIGVDRPTPCPACSPVGVG